MTGEWLLFQAVLKPASLKVEDQQQIQVKKNVSANLKFYVKGYFSNRIKRQTTKTNNTLIINPITTYKLYAPYNNVKHH